MKRFVCLGFIACLLVPRVSVASDVESSEGEDREVGTDLPIGPILLGGFGVVFVAVGAGFGWQAKQEFDDFNDETAIPQSAERASFRYPLASHKLADKSERHAVIADVLMFGGAAAVAGSVVWWLLSRGETEGDGDLSVSSSSARWRPLLGPGQAGLSVEF